MPRGHGRHRSQRSQAYVLMSQTAWSPRVLCNGWGEAVESSSRFATYVAFGLFSTVIFVFIIGHALFVGRHFSNHQTNKSISQLGVLRSGRGHGRVIRFFREFFIPDRSAVILGFPHERIKKINPFEWGSRSLVCRGLT